MRKASGKRHQHGITSAMVYMEVVRLARLNDGKPVSRRLLLRALPLEETTVDDRLRVLVKNGLLLNTGRGHYQPSQSPVEKVSGTLAHTPPPPPPPEPEPELLDSRRWYFLTPENDPGLAEAIRQRLQPSDDPQ